jgi:hypothetical protein
MDGYGAPWLSGSTFQSRSSKPTAPGARSDRADVQWEEVEVWLGDWLYYRVARLPEPMKNMLDVFGPRKKKFWICTGQDMVRDR